MMHDDERIDLASRAAQLLKSEIFNLATAAYKDLIFQQMENTEPSDTSRREQLYLELRVLKGLRDRIQSFVSDGIALERKKNQIRSAR